MGFHPNEVVVATMSLSEAAARAGHVGRWAGNETSPTMKPINLHVRMHLHLRCGCVVLRVDTLVMALATRHECDHYPQPLRSVPGTLQDRR